ncbi:MAG: bifunctional hydroxymethylpyrimidine kinase/phosphomethylpyrimidine kinase [Prevotellaceae bacterium]|nr:bifunctional hydroxymethylpyrimidine kinase/phosphomethylpyrimidine kinase [Prevotellaceae bacterium]
MPDSSRAGKGEPDMPRPSPTTPRRNPTPGEEEGAAQRPPFRPVVLTLAGSDSGGGAGIQADLKTITLLGGFGTCAVSALTAQNGLEVRGILETPPDFVRMQLAAVLDAFPVKAAKTGMLASAPIIEVAVDCLGRDKRAFPLVVDPVCVSQTGHRLLRPDAEDALRRLLLPEADLLTPTKPEAELLAGMSATTSADLRPLLDRLHALGARAVLLKGGHFAEFAGGESISDWLSLPGREPLVFSRPRVATVHTHGTGCTLSAALATLLAYGLPPEEAVSRAQAFLGAALEAAFAPGLGAGPPDLLSGAAKETMWHF